MYFWIVLGSVMVTLMALKEPVRDDYKEVTEVKSAESFANWVVTYHAAAQKYTSDVAYSNGVIPKATLSTYLPPEADFSSIDVTSQVFCYEKNADGSNSLMPCADDGSTINYLITFADIPYQWRMRGGAGARHELRRAIGKLTYYTVSAGVTETTPASSLYITGGGIQYGVEGSTLGVNSYSGGIQLYIPPAAQATVGVNSMVYLSILKGAIGGLPL